MRTTRIPAFLAVDAERHGSISDPDHRSRPVGYPSHRARLSWWKPFGRFVKNSCYLFLLTRSSRAYALESSLTFKCDAQSRHAPRSLRSHRADRRGRDGRGLQSARSET